MLHRLIFLFRENEDKVSYNWDSPAALLPRSTNCVYCYAGAGQESRALGT